MKKIWIVVLVLSSMLLSSFGFATNNSRSAYGDDPVQILDNVVETANDDYHIQQTALDHATNTQGAYLPQYKIANTLDWLRNNINPYLQRTVYIWLSAAVVLIIYNGFLMVTNAVHKEWDSAKVKKNIVNILIGVLVLTGFYFIIKLMVSLITSIFGWYGGDTWF